MIHSNSTITFSSRLVTEEKQIQWNLELIHNSKSKHQITDYFHGINLLSIRLEFFVEMKPVENIRHEVPQISPNQSVNQYLQQNRFDYFRLKYRFITIVDASEAPVFFQSIKAQYSASINCKIYEH